MILSDNMIKYYLCVKTHKRTGLKYLCQTKRNPFKYLGSGSDWLKHLQENGKEHSTEILQECQDKTDLKKWGIYYSELWNVVESSNWANKKVEIGDGGSSKGVNKGTINVVDKNGKSYRVEVSDPRIKTGELTVFSKGKTTAKDLQDNIIRVDVDDERLKNGILVPFAKGTVVVKDNTGKYSRVTPDDHRIKTGELTKNLDGLVMMMDSSGKVLQVTKDDQRISTGELVGCAKGKMVARDKTGNKVRVSVDDLRLVTGELVAVMKGTTYQQKNPRKKVVCPTCKKLGDESLFIRHDHFKKCSNSVV